VSERSSSSLSFGTGFLLTSLILRGLSAGRAILTVDMLVRNGFQVEVEGRDAEGAVSKDGMERRVKFPKNEGCVARYSEFVGR